MYLQMINQDVVPELEALFSRQVDGVFWCLWWFQNGTPAHRLVAVRERLREVFGNRVVALNHTVEWSPRSPDLIPYDFFLWGHLKSKVCSSPPNDLVDLENRIRQQLDVLRSNPAMVRRAFQEMLRCFAEVNFVLRELADMSMVLGHKRAARSFV